MRSDTHNQAAAGKLNAFIVCEYCAMKFCQSSEDRRGIHENSIDSETGGEGNEAAY